MVDWKLNLANYFEELRILQESKQEAIDNFNQFCEFIAEPAFESLEEEFKQYNIRTTVKRQRGRTMEFHIFFPRSRIDNFQYIVRLPKNALELTLRRRPELLDALEADGRLDDADRAWLAELRGTGL